MTLREVTNELSALATRRVELLKACVGKVYIKSLYLEKFCIGEGYDVLEEFFETWYCGNVTKENILHNIELSVLHAVLQPDSDQTICDITIDLGDRRIGALEMVQNFTMPPKLPDMPDIVMLPNPLTEKHNEPVPPYHSKLQSYDKRRNYAKKNCWNRIRSRCW